jgi:hypothetical protein
MLFLKVSDAFMHGTEKINKTLNCFINRLKQVERDEAETGDNFRLEG